MSRPRRGFVRSTHYLSQEQRKRLAELAEKIPAEGTQHDQSSHLRQALDLYLDMADRLPQLKAIAASEQRPLSNIHLDAVDLYLLFQGMDEELAEVLQVALKTFPETRTPNQAFRRMAYNWLHNRQADSKRGAIDRQTALTREGFEEVKEMIAHSTDRLLRAIRGESDDSGSSAPSDPGPPVDDG
jgi:hypothetical protein